jgi:hypothetical protein
MVGQRYTFKSIFQAIPPKHLHQLYPIQGNVFIITHQPNIFRHRQYKIIKKNLPIFELKKNKNKGRKCRLYVVWVEFSKPYLFNEV